MLTGPEMPEKDKAVYEYEYAWDVPHLHYRKTGKRTKIEKPKAKSAKRKSKPAPDDAQGT